MGKGNKGGSGGGATTTKPKSTTPSGTTGGTTGGAPAGPPPVVRWGNVELPQIASAAGLKPGAHHADVMAHFGSFTDANGFPLLSAQQIGEFAQDGQKALDWLQQSGKGVQLSTNVNPNTPRTETQISGEGSTATTKPGKRQKQPPTTPEQLGAYLEATEKAARRASSVVFSGPGVKFRVTYDSAGRPVAVPDGSSPAPATTTDGTKTRSKKGKGPAPGTPEFRKKVADERMQAYGEKGQNPPVTFGMEEWIRQNAPTLKRVAGLSSIPALIGGGYAIGNAIMGSGSNPQPQQQQEYRPPAALAPPAPKPTAPVQATPQQEPAGTPDDANTTLMRLLRSREYA